MSAFVVSHDHINALVTFLLDKKTSVYLRSQKRWIEATDLTAQQIGEILLKENIRSVLERYPDCKGGRDLPGVIGETVENYTFKRRSTPMKPVEILKSCSCLDYQSCETDDWSETDSYRIIKDIEAAAVRSLPGYEAAPWGI